MKGAKGRKNKLSKKRKKKRKHNNFFPRINRAVEFFKQVNQYN